MSLALAFAALLSLQDPAPVAPGPTDCPRMASETTSPAQHEVFCFVGWLYGPGTLETVTPLGADAPRVFTVAAQADMAAARRHGGDDGHPAFDADPVCNCQDPSGLRFLSASVPESSATEAVAVVHFDFGQGVAFSPVDSRRRHTLHLKKEADGWRIDDITDASGWSFRASLAQD